MSIIRSRACLPSSVASLLIAVAACSKPASSPTPTVPVVVARVIRGAAPSTATANGTVEPIQSADVAAQVAGLVTSVAFREGDMVRAGQVLFRIDPRPYAAALAQAEAALARDDAQLVSARRDAERYETLARDDYVTRSQTDAQRATADALAATVNADRAAIDRARLDLANTVIRAPISGRSGSLLVRQGNLVQPSPAQPLVVINQIDPIRVRFELPASVFPAVQRARRDHLLPVRVATADSGGSTVSGWLRFINNAIDTATGTVQLKAEFANGGGQLWPGQFVTASLQLEVQPNALLVPSAAVQAGQQGAYVFVVDSAGHAAMKQIVTGRIVDDLVVVTRGLTAGEPVVVDGQSRLAAGARVRITAEQPMTPPSVRATP